MINILTMFAYETEFLNIHVLLYDAISKTNYIYFDIMSNVLILVAF